MPKSAMKSDEEKNESTSSICENVGEYLLSSTLHGLRYIGTATLSVFERVFFGLSFLMVTVLAAYFISNVWQKWKDTPVIIGLDPVSTQIKDIPFPAVTICNMNQVKRSFAESLKKESDKVILESICSQGDSLKHNDSNIEGTWSYVREFLVNSSQPCEDMIKMCKFGMESIDCEHTFGTVLTDEGICCTFNAIHPTVLFKNFDLRFHVDDNFDGFENDYMTWTPDKGYDKSSKMDPFPRPGMI